MFRVGGRSIKKILIAFLQITSWAGLIFLFCCDETKLHISFNLLVVLAAGIVIYWAASMIATAWLTDIKINCFKKKQPEVHKVIEEVKEVKLIKDYSKEFKELSDKYGRKPTPIDELCNSFMNEK